MKYFWVILDEDKKKAKKKERIIYNKNFKYKISERIQRNAKDFFYNQLFNVKEDAQLN